MITRDRKGQYSNSEDLKVKGWIIFGTEEDIKTGQDSYATILCDQTIRNNQYDPQDIYNIIESIECGTDVEGFKYIDQYTIETCELTTEGNK